MCFAFLAMEVGVGERGEEKRGGIGEVGRRGKKRDEEKARGEGRGWGGRGPGREEWGRIFWKKVSQGLPPTPTPREKHR